MDIVKFFTVEKHCDPMCTDSDQVTHSPSFCCTLQQDGGNEVANP